MTTMADIVLINRPLTERDSRYNYPHKLLSEILRITEAQYGKTEIKQAHLKMSRDRTLRELEKGTDIHVMAEATKLLWEEKLIPIRIPIRKGIQGFRIFLILKKYQLLLSNIKTIEALKKLPTGSGLQWSITQILIENGFNVKTGNNYEGLFSMLIKERFMTFGRGINETTKEYSRYKEKFPELSIEKDLLLYIPLPTYFFVSPAKPILAERIETGLLKMIADGSFDIMFNKEFSLQIESANLKNRKVFYIENKNLSLKTPFDVKHYWYHPNEKN
jgi:hypothetical protein